MVRSLLVALLLGSSTVQAREAQEDFVVDGLPAANAVTGLVTVDKIINWHRSESMLIRTAEATINPASCTETSSYAYALSAAHFPNRWPASPSYVPPNVREVRTDFTLNVLYEAMIAARQVKLFVHDTECKTDRPLIVGVTVEVSAPL